jgi:hypothetical protein
MARGATRQVGRLTSPPEAIQAGTSVGEIARVSGHSERRVKARLRLAARTQEHHHATDDHNDEQEQRHLPEQVKYVASLSVASAAAAARCLTQTAAVAFFCVLFAKRATPGATMVVAAPGWTPANSQSARKPLTEARCRRRASSLCR